MSGRDQNPAPQSDLAPGVEAPSLSSDTSPVASGETEALSPTPDTSPVPSEEAGAADPTTTPEPNSPRPPNERGAGSDDDDDPFRVALDIVEGHDGKVWRDPDGREFISLTKRPKDGGVVTDHLPVRGGEFKTFVQMGIFDLTDRMPPNGVVEHVVSLYAGRARQAGSDCIYDVFTRIAVPQDENRVFLDLANEQREVVEIDASGFQIRPSSEVPVKFLRPQGMLPLPRPLPVEDGSALLTLQEIAGLSDELFVLLLAFLVGCANPARVYPLLLLQGGQGSGKSTLAHLTRTLIDPQSVSLSSEPSSELDLLIAASNRHLLVYDNLSGMRPQLSDALCRLSTGGGLIKRKLYSDREEERFTTTCPVILNGIDDLGERNDLADRSISLHLPSIPAAKRERKEIITRRFTEAHPAMLGALCLAWSAALRLRDEVSIDEPPRMADFTYWVVAAEPALPIAPGAFLKAYRANIASAAEASVEHDPVASFIVALMEGRRRWEGSMTDLLATLKAKHPTGELAKVNTRKLSSLLRRAEPALQRVGISVYKDPHHMDPKNRRKIYVITREADGDG